MRILLVLVLSLPAPANDFRQRGAELEAGRQWNQAAALYQTALTQASNPDDRFWLLTSLAEMEFELRNYSRSEGWLHQADTLVAQFQNPVHQARLANAWGTLWLVQGNLTAAQRKLMESIELSRSSAPREDQAAALHNLAAVEMNAGQLREALEHETRALELWQSALGSEHYYVMKAWISLSSVHGLRKDWLAAEQCLLQALAIRRSPEALENYAVVLDKLKRGREAKAIRSGLGTGHVSEPVLVDVKSLLARAPTAVRSR